MFISSSNDLESQMGRYDDISHFPYIYSKNGNLLFDLYTTPHLTYIHTFLRLRFNYKRISSFGELNQRRKNVGNVVVWTSGTSGARWNNGSSHGSSHGRKNWSGGSRKGWNGGGGIIEYIIVADLNLHFYRWSSKVSVSFNSSSVEILCGGNLYRTSNSKLETFERIDHRATDI